MGACFFCLRISACGVPANITTVFSAPQGHASKNNGFFLRRRVGRQKTTDFFCAGGSGVKKQWIFSAPEGRSSKNNGFFLRLRVTRQKFLNRLMLAVQLRAPNENSACN